MILKPFMALCLAAGLSSVANADEAGRAEYLASCASCHGEAGAGDGPLAEMMTVPVPGLTGLSAANDGAFPMLETIQVIDGRTGMRGHGYPMPVWGARYKAEAMGAGDYSAEIRARGRVLSLALYLQSIQE
ncbi:MAG: c-type cytochrome [Paracoccaceae bacterium]